MIAAFAAALFCGSASAQNQPGPGQVMGNSTAAARPVRAENLTAILDRAFSSAPGSVLARGVSWGVLAGTATARLPLLSGASTTPVWGAYSLPASVTSGGIACFTSTTVEASSGLLTANAILLGGGAGVCPSPMASLGTTTTVLHGNAAGAPTFGAVVYADIATAAIATASDITNANANVLVPAANIYTSESTTTYAASLVFSLNSFINTSVTLTGNVTSMTLNNVKAGQAGTIAFIQDGTGSRTTVWSGTLKFAGGVTPVLTTTAAAIDILSYSCRTTTFCVAALIKDVK